MQLFKLQHVVTAKLDDLMPRGLYLAVEGKEGGESIFGMMLERALPFRVYQTVMKELAGSLPAEEVDRLAEENGISFRAFDDLDEMAGLITDGMALLVRDQGGSKGSTVAVDPRQHGDSTLDAGSKLATASTP